MASEVSPEHIPLPGSFLASKDVPWYYKDVPELNEPSRHLLETYSKIPPERVTAHVIDIRNRAWKIYPYACIGMFRFLDLSRGQGPQHKEVLERLADGQKLLDLGCCFGQEIRRLVADGAPSENLYASDLRNEFWDLGYELFLDKSTLKSHYIRADVFDQSSQLNCLNGTIDIITANSFFHLFDWDEQVTVAKRCIQLLHPRKGSMILGRHVGNKNPGSHPKRSGGQFFRHNDETWRKFWKEIGKATGTSWSIWTHLRDSDDKVMKYYDKPVDGQRSGPDGQQIMRYAVRLE